MSETLTVHLTYFRTGGKYYTEGKFGAPGLCALDEIWELVRRMKVEDKAMPGLAGVWDGPILVTVPGHVHDHPRLIL